MGKLEAGKETGEKWWGVNSGSEYMSEYTYWDGGQGVIAIYEVGLIKIVQVFGGERGLVKQKKEIMMAP